MAPKKKDTWIVEKVLSDRVQGGQQQVLVKWAGFPDKNNSWIDVKENKRNIIVQAYLKAKARKKVGDDDGDKGEAEDEEDEQEDADEDDEDEDSGDSEDDEDDEDEDSEDEDDEEEENDDDDNDNRAGKKRRIPKPTLKKKQAEEELRSKRAKVTVISVNKRLNRLCNTVAELAEAIRNNNNNNNNSNNRVTVRGRATVNIGVGARPADLRRLLEPFRNGSQIPGAGGRGNRRVIFPYLAKNRKAMEHMMLLLHNSTVAAADKLDTAEAIPNELMCMYSHAINNWFNTRRKGLYKVKKDERNPNGLNDGWNDDDVLRAEKEVDWQLVKE